MRRLLWPACALLAAFGTACGKTNAPSVAATPDPTTTGGSSSGSGGSAPLPPGGMATSACTTEGPNPGPAPLAALSNFELNRSVRALLGDGLEPSVWLKETGELSPFSSAVPPAPEREMYNLARDVALTLSQDTKAVQAISGCDPAASGAPTCASQFIGEFLERAFRRPITQEDEAAFKGVFAEGERLGGDFASGVRAVVEVALQSPDFLYLVETGNGESADGAVALTGYESAARLAYFLTGSPPDEDLRAASAKGAMSADALEEEARRLLGSPASRERLRHYYSELLGIGLLDTSDELTLVLSQLSQEETGRFVEEVTFDGSGTFRALLTEPSTWVNAQLAQFYGVPGVTGTQFQKVALEPTQRGGVFTQAAFLHAKSHSDQTSPVHRGLAVLRTLLCYDMPPPPPNVPPLPPQDAGPNATLRERLTLETQDVVCQQCHHDIDPAGYAFEHYDAAGKWRDTDNGQAIDSSGELYKTDAKGKFNDAIEMLARIAESDDAKACFVQRWQAEAFRRAAEPGDACATEQVSQAFSDSDGNLVELLVALAKNDNFRFRLKSELQP